MFSRHKTRFLGLAQVSCYKLFKVMSNVIIQENKKLERYYAIDNEFTPADFFIDSCEVYETFRSSIINLFLKISSSLQRERLKFFVKKCAIKKCIAMNFVKNRERGQAGISTFF